LPYTIHLRSFRNVFPRKIRSRRFRFPGNTQIYYNIKVKKGQKNMKAFYVVAKQQLENKGMSIYRLSKETGIFEQTLYSMFNGKTFSPTLDNAVKIAKVLDIDLNKLKVGD